MIVILHYSKKANKILKNFTKKLSVFTELLHEY